MPSVDLHGARVAYREAGSGGLPVLLVHGAGGSSLLFSELVTLLGRSRRTVALDLPGHGGSGSPEPWPPVEELLERYAHTVEELAEKLGLGPLVLVGHSMGGAVAQLLALRSPERVRALVLLATGARLRVDPSVLSAIRDHFDELPALLAATSYSPASDRRQVEAWARAQVQSSREVMLADFEACAHFDLREHVGALRMPVSILSASDDLLTPPKVQARFVELVPRARLVPLSRTGHFLHVERPDAVAAAIAEASPPAHEAGVAST
jgi:pimeloyl-ACP methyl ester carboxylesterase